MSDLTPEYLQSMSVFDLHRLSSQCDADPYSTQEKLLQLILRANQATEYGQKYSFSSIKSYDDFKDRVPIVEWGDIENDAERMANGALDVLFPGQPVSFIATSGTTGNKPKWIPESADGAIARNLVTLARLAYVNAHFPGLMAQGTILVLANSPSELVTPSGVPITYASSFALERSLRSGAHFKLAWPLEIASVQDPELRDYVLMRFAVQKKDVTAVAGNNAGRFKELALLANARCDAIINDIEYGTISGNATIEPHTRELLQRMIVPDPVRAEELRQIQRTGSEFLPKHYWPSLSLLGFWLSSSVGHYVRDVKSLVPDNVRYMDIGYGASEGKFNIPVAVGNPAGKMALLTSFYEFLPEHSTAPVLIHQVEDQQRYELIITTWSGLYRYNLKDVIKIDGFTENNPNIVFEYKSGEILNIAEEKIPAPLVDNLIRKVGNEMGIELVQVQIYPSLDERRYVFYIEPCALSIGFDREALAKRIHHYLGKEFIIYDLLVSQQRLLKEPRIIEMRQGWQKHLHDSRSGINHNTTQLKLPTMITEKPDSSWQCFNI